MNEYNIDTKVAEMVVNRLTANQLKSISALSGLAANEIWFIQESAVSGQPIVVDTRKVFVPTKTSQLENDSGFAYSWDIPYSISQLNNDVGYITSAYVDANASKTTWIDWSTASAAVDYVDYINTNKSDFDTGIYPTATTRIECGIRGDAYGNWFVGTDDQNWRFFNAGDNSFYFDWYSRISQGTWSTEEWYDISVGNYWFNVVPRDSGYDALYQQDSAQGSAPETTLKIGNSEYNGGEAFDVEYIRIYDNDTLVKDYRPALDDNGVACFYEEVEGTYEYPYNGTFTAHYN